ncbi:MAG: hypothetical protein PSN44_02490 [Gammaproteobacteria bacterium]|nr:hypothetical protein [Gammaproteobacteria bacterium]
MSNKAKELDARNIMQGLEEFANFMSFNANSNGLRILSVETVEQAVEHQPATSTADILNMKQHAQKEKRTQQQTLNKALSFRDQQVH